MKPVAKRKVKDVFMTGSARTIVITGASKGMGRALAVGFANDGYTVFGAARDAKALDQTAEQCPPGRFHGRALDVSNARVVAGWIEEIESSQGKVDVLICAAAVYPRAYFLDQSAERLG
jgi:gluconate 5-dehydrogenase/2-deoxy-D-gluconate 3-dehydrogenase